jgi:hypothetical protein
LTELDARLRDTAASLNPDQLLAALADYLRQPEASLRLTPVSITVDRLGIVNDPAVDDDNVNTLDFPEFHGRDKRSYMAILARVRRDEAQAAVDLVRDRSRRYMII